MFLMTLELDRTREQTSQLDREQTKNNKDFEDDYEIRLEEIDDIRGIFFLICEELEKYDFIRFRVEGFGSPWPVDVSTDLLTVVEQLSDLLKFIDTPESVTFSLCFYEQKSQRTIVFSKVEDNLVKINCHKQLEYAGNPDREWGKDIEEEPIKLASLKLMICNLTKMFVAIADELCPTLTSHPFFQEWCHAQYIADCL